MMKILLLISTIFMTVTSRRLLIEDEEHFIQREQDVTMGCIFVWNTFVGKVKKGEQKWCDIFGTLAETAQVLGKTQLFTGTCMYSDWFDDERIHRTTVVKSKVCAHCKMEWYPVKERINKVGSNWCEEAACAKMVNDAEWAGAKDVDDFLSACEGDRIEIENYLAQCRMCEGSYEGDCKSVWNTFVGKVKKGEQKWCDIFGTLTEAAQVLGKTPLFTATCVRGDWFDDERIHGTAVDKSKVCAHCKMEWYPVKERINKVGSNWCEEAACAKMVNDAEWAGAKDVDDFLSACEGDRSEIENYLAECRKCEVSYEGDCKSVWNTFVGKVKKGEQKWCDIFDTTDMAEKALGKDTLFIANCMADVWIVDPTISGTFLEKMTDCNNWGK